MAPLYYLTIMSIITIALKSDNGDGYRILGIFPLNGKSRTIYGEHLMKVLAKRGHQVDVISHFPQKKPFPNYKDLSIRGSLPDTTNNFSYSLIKDFPIDSMESLMKVTGDTICKLLKHPVISNLIKNPPKDPPYDLVIIEYFAAQCYFAFGRHLKVPMIGVSVSVLLQWQNQPLGNPTSSAFFPGAFSDFPSTFWQRLQNVLLSEIIHYQFNTLASRQKKYVDENFGPGYPSIYELSKEMALVFVNSHYSVNGVRPLTQGVVEIGGIHIHDGEENLSPELQKWLDESRHGCVYVSFGSMVTLESFPRKTLKAFYAAFKNIAPVRVLMKIVNIEKMPPGLPDNVYTHYWLPQIQVLKHKNVRAFVTHGGVMSTLESIYAGVPMIGFPLFGDQSYNLKIHEKKKILVTLNHYNITGEEFIQALNTILKNPEYRNNIEKVSKLYYDRPSTPQDTAVFWVEYVIRNGNILRSPAANLAWWQVELFDVYGFILFMAMLAFYILVLIIKLIFKLICKLKWSDKDALLSKKQK